MPTHIKPQPRSLIASIALHLFLLLLGAAITFTIINFWLLGGWSIPAFLALGSAFPFGYLIAPAILLGGGLLFILLAYISRALIGLCVEYTIKSTIQSTLTNKNKRQFDVQNLLGYLKLASDGYYDKNCLDYSLGGKSLLALALEQAEKHWEDYCAAKKRNLAHENEGDALSARQSLLLAQDWNKLIHILWQGEKPSNPIPLTYPQRFLFWVTQTLGINCSFPQLTTLSDDAIVRKTQDSLNKRNLSEEKKENQSLARKANSPTNKENENSPSLREKSSPAHISKQQFSRPKEVKFPPEFEESTKIETLPAHLRPWLTKLSLVHQQDQHYVQQQAVAQ